MASDNSKRHIEAETFTNVFEALGLENAEQEMARCELVGRIFRIGRERRLSDPELAELAGCPPERMAQLHAAEFDGVTIDELCGYLVALGHGVRIIVEPSGQTEAHLSVAG